MKKLLSCIALSSLLLLGLAPVQAEQGDLGLGLRFSTVSQSFSLRPYVVAAYWATPQMVLEPRIGFDNTKDYGTDIHGGLGINFYLSQNEVSPFVGLNVNVLYFTPKTGDSQMDLGLGVVLGTEYKMSESFSLVGEWGVNDLMGGDKNPHTPHSSLGFMFDSTSINTGTALTLRFYLPK